MSDFRISFSVIKGKNGCSENWYAAGSLASVMAVGQQLVAARNLILVGSCYIADLFVRGVSPDVLGQTDYDPLETQSYGAIRSDNGDANNVGALIKIATTQGFHAKPYIHGMPDTWVYSGPTGIQHLTGDADKQLSVYFAKVQALGLGLRGLVKVRPDTRSKPINNFSYAPLTGLWTITAAGFTFVEGETVLVRRPKGYLVRQFRGRWKVITGGVGTCTASANRAFDTSAVYKPNTGTVDHIIYGVDPVSSYKVLRPGTRKMGRIPNVVPGRRSASR